MHSNINGKLIVRAGVEGKTEFTLSETRCVIGRETHVDVQIVTTGVSREHARITFADGRAFIEDLNSSNGTFVNGQRISARTALNTGDQIGLGQSVKLEFAASVADSTSATIIDPLPAAADKTTIEPPLKMPSQPRPRLIVTIGSQAPERHTLSSNQLSVGRLDSNDIVLPVSHVSRRHFQLFRTGNQIEIEVSPTAGNPVLCNGQPIAGRRALRPGDMLQIGQGDPNSIVRMQLEVPGAAPADSTQIGARPQPPVPDASMAATQGLQAMKPASKPAAQTPAGTMLYDPNEMPELTIPPRLIVTIAGQDVTTHVLTKDRYRIGRSADNDIVISSPIVSRLHFGLERDGVGYRVIPMTESGNPLVLEGKPVTGPQKLDHEDVLRIGGLDPGVLVSLNYLSPSEMASKVQPIAMPESRSLTIGRNDENDVVLDSPVVSGFHAQIEQVGQRYRVRDLRSSNGTFVNDERIESELWLKANDEIRIGSNRFVVGDGTLSQRDESSGLRVVAASLNKWVRKDLNILQDISLIFQPKEFVVVVGQSGGGKSTLVDSIAGYRPATHGSVEVNGIDVYKNFDAIRNEIGFVPQKDIIHMELSIYEALDYTARLRMPSDTTKAERHKRVMEVLEDLDLAHRKDVPIHGLSGGQQKRVSIGVELLTKPGLFFLDEPTSGLDPGTETALMQLMRRLADQGRTIVLITHATKNVMLADKVVFLARGGYLCWFGPPDEGLAYFDQYRTDRERRASKIEFDDLYSILEDPNRGSPEEWAKRYKEHSAFKEYIGEPQGVVSTPSADAVAKPTRRSQNKVGALRQFAILSARNLRILMRDKFSLFLMLAAAPLVSMLDVVLALALGSNPFDFVTGNLPNVMLTLFLPTVYGVMVGGLAQMREIVKEQDIYKRERLVNLKVLPYIMSKIWVAGLLALYQTAAYVIVHYVAFDMPGGPLEFGLIYISLALATMAGMMLGLFASALAPTPNAAPLIIIMLMLPQIVLSGALLPLPTTMTAPISTRWAFEAFMTITGTGSDVAADACWLLPEEDRSLLTLEYKEENCRCMGVNVVNQDSCDFPGLGEFYNEAIDTEPPVEPPPLRAEPPQPVVPERPPEPEDRTDQVAMAEYFDALEAWQTQAEGIQAGYEAEIAAYRAEGEIYQATVIQYQTDLADWQISRASAIEPAEGLINQFYDAFGWTFKSREDTTAYYVDIATTWFAQFVIIGVLFVAILILQKRKDVI